MKIIISGVPCSGKTRFGDWLRDVCGYAHINLEDESLYVQQVIGPSLLKGFPCWLSSTTQKVVVTWGFPPNDGCYRVIRAFEDSGFTPWWFDSDFQLARARYVARDGEERAQAYFDPQAQRIAEEKQRLELLYQKRRLATLASSGYLTPQTILGVLSSE